MCIYVFKFFSEITGPTESNFHVEPSWDRGKDGLGHLLLFIIVNLRGVGAFSRDFTTNLAPQCRAFS